MTLHHRISTLVFSLLFLSPAFSHGEPKPTTVPVRKNRLTGLPSRVVSEPFGVAIHLGHYGHGSPGQEVARMAKAGFRWIRIDVPWDVVEPQKGNFDFGHYDKLMEAIESHTMRAVLILCYWNHNYDDGVSPHTPEGRKAFLNYVEAITSRYRGRGVIWEVWNEPNLAHFWRPKPNVDDYITLVRKTVEVIRRQDPGAAVIAPSPCSFDWGFYEACFQRGLLKFIDAVSTHPYRHSEDRGEPEGSLPQYDRLRGLIARYAPAGKTIPLVCSEFGYSTHTHGASKPQQAAFLARLFLTNLMADVRLTIWYDWKNDGGNRDENEHNFGMIDDTGKPKPAHQAAQTMLHQLHGCRFAGRVGRLERRLLEDEYLLLFQGRGRYVLAAWITGDDRWLPVPVTSPEVRLVDMLGNEQTVKTENNQLWVRLTRQPVYLHVPSSDAQKLKEQSK